MIGNITHLNDSFIKTKETAINALSRILEEVKEGCDHRKLHMEFIKLADTRNPTLKKIINEFLLHYNDPKYLLLVTNTTLKDLNDIDLNIIILALDFVTRTNYLDEYFICHILRLARSDVIEIRKLAFQALERFFKKSEWIVKYELKKEVLRIVEDYGVEGLKIAYNVFESCDVLGNEIWEMISRNNGDDINLLLLLIIYKRIKHESKISNDKKQDDIICVERNIYTKHEDSEKLAQVMNNLYGPSSLSSIDHITRNENGDKIDVEIAKINLKPETVQKIKNVCKIEMTSDKIERVFLACKIMVLIDSGNLQSFFNILLRFSKYATKKSFFILDYLRELILCFDQINYENSEFCIFESDPIYIKRIKLNILDFRFDDISFAEIKFCAKVSELRFDCLNLFLKHDIIDRELLRECLKSDPALSIDIICKNKPYSSDVNNVIFENIKCLSYGFDYEEKWCYLVCMTAADASFVESFLDKKSIKIQVQSLCTLFYFNKISIDRFRELNPMKNNCELLLSNLEHLKFEIEDTFIYNPNDKIFSGYINKQNIVSKHVLKKPVNSIILYTADENLISYQLIGLDESIYLSVIRIENEVSLQINEKLFVLKKEENLFLMDLDKNFINTKFNIVYKGTVKHVNISLMSFSSLFECDLHEFNSNFASTEYYEIFALKYFKYNVQKIDNNSFVFKIFGRKFYGMSLSGQVIIKSEDNAMLKRIGNCIRSGYHK